MHVTLGQPVPRETPTSESSSTSNTQRKTELVLWPVTTDLSKANRVSRGMRTGFVWVNGYARHDNRAPFGGYKQSGIGREGGKYSEDFYTEQKGIEFSC